MNKKMLIGGTIVLLMVVIFWFFAIIGLYSVINPTKEPISQVQNDSIVIRNKYLELKKSDSTSRVTIEKMKKQLEILVKKVELLEKKSVAYDTAFSEITTWN